VVGIKYEMCSERMKRARVAVRAIDEQMLIKTAKL